MIKSIFEPLVEPAQNINSGETNTNGRILTIPTVGMTFPRPFLASKCAEMLIRGKGPVTPLVALTFATDMEGTPGRIIDKLLPDSGLGTSEFGAKADIVADTVALLEIGGAALFAPRMPITGKLAVGITLGHESLKSVWGLRKNHEYRNAGSKENLYIKPTIEGKCSMAEKMVAVGLAVLASDFNKQKYRQPIAATALAFAVIGTARGEEQRQEYREIADNMIAELSGNIPELNSNIDPEIMAAISGIGLEI
jgi:hypothetical protein